MRLGLHRLAVDGQERTDYSFRKDAVAAGYALHEKDGPLQTDSEAFFWKDGLVRAAGGAEEPSPADRARVNGVVFDAVREHLVPDFHTVTILGRMGREAFDKEVLARDDVRSADVSAVFRAAANVLLVAAGEKPRKTPSYWEAQLVFTPKGDVLVLAGHHPCAMSTASTMNRWLFAELEAVAFRGLRDHIVPLAASPLMWSASFSSGAVYKPTAVFDDAAYADWTEPRGDEKSAPVGRDGAVSRVARSRRIVANAGTEPAPRALLSAARFFVGASKGGSSSSNARAFLAAHGYDVGKFRSALEARDAFVAAVVAKDEPLAEDVKRALDALVNACPLQILEEYGYDLGRRPAAEALESSLADAADAGEELEPRLVGALLKLAGNANGGVAAGSWPHATLADHGVDLGDKPAAEVHAALVASGVPLHEDVEAAFAVLATRAKNGANSRIGEAERAPRRVVYDKECNLLDDKGWKSVKRKATSQTFATVVSALTSDVAPALRGTYSKGGFTSARDAAMLADAINVELGRPALKNFVGEPDVSVMLLAKSVIAENRTKLEKKTAAFAVKTPMPTTCPDCADPKPFYTQDVQKGKQWMSKCDRCRGGDCEFQRRSRERERGGKSTASKAPAKAKTRTVSKAKAKKAPAKKKAKPAPA
jgi:hypothetical protein